MYSYDYGYGTFEISGRFYRFKSGPHLTRGDDWHTAYVDMIYRFLEGPSTQDRPAELPAYPLRFDNSGDWTDLLVEMGAYWEGALHFLYRSIGTSDPLEKIRQIEDLCSDHNDNCSGREKLFLKIWNSHGQLKWLKAFLIGWNNPSKVDCFEYSSEKLYQAGIKDQNQDILWLSSFVSQHGEEGRKYPNPFFGGGNPLHLTIIS